MTEPIKPKPLSEFTVEDVRALEQEAQRERLAAGKRSLEAIRDPEERAAEALRRVDAAIASKHVSDTAIQAGARKLREMLADKRRLR